MLVEENDTEVKLITILKLLNNSPEPIGSTKIYRALERDGIVSNERTIRYYLKLADERGYTLPYGQDGRMITAEGRRQIRDALVLSKLDTSKYKLEKLAYQTTFDPQKASGRLPVNVSLIRDKDIKEALRYVKDAFKAGFGVSDLVALAHAGELIGSVVIPPGYVGLATVCSVTINGVLLKAGVPTEYSFGGLLEICNSQPKRFVAIINYDGSSLDPSEEFIRSRMTSVAKTVKIGIGKVIGVFRTMPALAKEIVENKISLLRGVGIGGVSAIGRNGEPVYRISVAFDRIGLVQLSGLNSVAAAVEAGIEIETIAGSGMIEFRHLQHVEDLC